MNEQLCFLGFGLSLEEKIKKSILTIQTYEEEALRRDPVNGYYLCDSFGKDSCVILHLAQQAGVKFTAHHSLTTIDPPELVLFGKKNHTGTIIHKPAKPLLAKVANDWTVLPSRRFRVCCGEYKEAATSGDSVIVLGVRAQESTKRANWKVWTPLKKKWALNPILYWTDENVWQYIKQNNIPYCSLYDKGWKRLGCIGCPLASTKERLRHFALYPKYEKLWKDAVTKFWIRMHNAVKPNGEYYYWHKFNTADELYQFWMEMLPEEEDDCMMGLF